MTSQVTQAPAGGPAINSFYYIGLLRSHSLDSMLVSVVHQKNALKDAHHPTVLLLAL